MLRHLSAILVATVGLLPLGAFGSLILWPAAASRSAVFAPEARHREGTPAAKTRGQAPATPSLALAPEQAYGKYRDPALCAAECFEAVASYSTPAYVSLDQARSVTLVYRSGQATPRGIVLVDATDPGPTAAAKMSIKIDRGNGTYVSSTGGVTEVFYATGLGINRLAFIFSASSDGMTSLSYKAVVTAYDASGVASAPAEIPVRVLVVNERSSPFGAGWSIAGFGRVYERSNGSLLITNGDGSAGFFEIGSCPSTCSFTSPSGDFSTVTRRASWTDGIKWDRRFPDGTQIAYRSDGQIASVMDRFGISTQYVYDAGSKLDLIRDPASLYVDFNYDANGKVSSITTPGGRVTQLTVNAAGDLTRIVDPDGVIAATFTYDASHRMLTRTDRRGGVWGYGYDFADKLSRDTMPQITADGALVRPIVRLRSLETASLVNTSSGLGSSSNPAPRVRPDTLRATVTNPRGYTTRLQVDGFGAPTRIEEPLGGRRFKITRDFAGRPTRTVSPAEHTVWYTWSATLPNLNQARDSVTGRVISYEYDSTGYNLLTRVYGDIPEVRHFPDVSGGVIDSTKVAGGKATVYTYDARARVVIQKDPEGHEVHYAYATSGFLNLRSVTAAGRTSRYGRDAFGRVVADTAPDGSVTTRRYDLLNRDTLIVGPMSDTTITRYDALFPTSVRDAKNQRYGFARNALGWVESDTFPVPSGVNAVRRYTYDQNGNLRSSVNRRGQTVSFTYDELDNLLTRTADGQTTTFSTHPMDFFVAVANAESVDTVRLHTVGWPMHQIAVRGGTRYELRSTHDMRGQRTRVRMASPWEDTVRFAYNGKEQLDTLVDLDGRRTVLGADQDFLPTTIALPTNPALTVLKEHPATHTPSAVLYSDPAINYAIGFQYAYNQAGQVSRRILDGQSDATTQTGREFGYDRLRRLTGYNDYVETGGTSSCGGALVDENGNPCTTGASREISNLHSFTYDKVGNRTDAGALVLPGNRLVRFAGDTMTYDADGNLTRRWRLSGGFDQTLSWNSLGQLTGVTTNGAAVSFAYDGFGRRARKSSASGTSVYIWDGDDLWAEVDGAGNRVAEYTYYPGDVDRPHSVRRWSGGTPTMYYFATDHPGNVVGLVNGSRQLVNYYAYRPFGALEDSSVSVANALRFAARELDGETGLYHVRARYYDPSVGRFISEDPIALAGGINPFVYAGNDPVNGRDPSGLSTCVEVPVTVYDLVDGELVAYRTTVTLCSGQGSAVGQVLDFAAGFGVGGGSGTWGGGALATPVGLGALGPQSQGFWTGLPALDQVGTRTKPKYRAFFFSAANRPNTPEPVLATNVVLSDKPGVSALLRLELTGMGTRSANYQGVLAFSGNVYAATMKVTWWGPFQWGTVTAVPRRP